MGGLILTLLLTDVFLTVFHAQGHGGPLTRRQNRLVWSLSRRVGVRRDGAPRDALLGLAAPVMIVVTFVTWVALLVAGFALVYLPWIETFLVSPGSLRDPWLEAFYFSGYTAATLGLGDLVPDQGVLRLLTPLEAFGGFALLSASLTYLLAVYRELIEMQALASETAGYRRVLDRGRSGRSGGDDGHSLDRWAEDAASRLTYVLQSHFQYPILHYFRPRERDRALPVQLGPLLDLSEVPVTEAEDQRAGAEASRLSFLVLRDALTNYLMTVDDVFVPDRFGGGGEGPDMDQVRRAHARLLDYMRYRRATDRER